MQKLILFSFLNFDNSPTNGIKDIKDYSRVPWILIFVRIGKNIPVPLLRFRKKASCIASRERFDSLTSIWIRVWIRHCRDRGGTTAMHVTSATCETSGIFHVKEWEEEKERQRESRPKDEFLKRCTPSCHASPGRHTPRPRGNLYCRSITRAFIQPDTTNYIAIVPPS